MFKAVVFDMDGVLIDSAGAAVIGFTKYDGEHHPLKGTVMNIQEWDEISYDTLAALAQHRRAL